VRNYIFFILFVVIIAFYTGCSLPEPEDIDPPVVAILYPQTGMSLVDSVTIIIESTDDEEVKEVRCYLDDQIVGTSASHAPRFHIDITPYADNNIHIISASAKDAAGNVGFTTPPVSVNITDNIDRTSPLVELLYPLAGEIDRGIVTFNIYASDNQGLNRLVVYIDEDSVFSINATAVPPPFSYAWDTTPYILNSEHAIYIKAVDNAGNEAYTTPIMVTIINLQADIIPPSVTLLYPIIGMVLSGNVSVRADVNDNVQVDSVQFHIDGKLEETDLGGKPWGFEWNTIGIADTLTHTLYIKAFDSSGNIGTAGPVPFTITL
jgi:hypothetical protein